MFSRTTRVVFVAAFVLLYGSSFATSNPFGVPDTVKSKKKQVINDSLRTNGESQSNVKPDTLKSLHQNPIGELPGFYSLTKPVINKHDYRYTGDILRYLPFSFQQSLGSFGQPAELQFFGLGNGSISYVNDGISLNNRWQNSFNPYFLQSENLETVELQPITSGFYYSPVNNPIALNSISRDQIDRKAYSKIRFHQAPNDEGMVDVMFSGYLFPRTNISFGFSNMAIDPPGSNKSYNNDYSSWLAYGKVHYLLSNSFNIITAYRHARSQIGLFGGVVNSADAFNSNTATAIFSDRLQRTVKNEISTKLLANIDSVFTSDFTVYYQYDRNEFRQNTTSSDDATVKHNHETKNVGASLNQSFKMDWFDLNMLGNYERTEISSPLILSQSVFQKFSLGSKLDINLFDSVNPSGFVKYLNFNKQSYFGFGGEVKINLFENILGFAGLSYFEKPHSILGAEFAQSGSGEKEKINSFQTTLEFRDSSYAISISYFVLNNNAMLLPVLGLDSTGAANTSVVEFHESDVTRQGINLSSSISLWKILIETNASYYFNIEDNQLFSTPEFAFTGGIYYSDILFNSNLNLKVGLNYRFTGAKDYSVVDFEKGRSAFYSRNILTNQLEPAVSEIIPWSQQFDIFVAGTIQEKATVYFVFENLLDEQYYVVPYYPMNAQGIRLGLSWEFLD